MGVDIEALFTSALGLQEPWSVEKVELDTARGRIDFELTCKATRLPCPHCDMTEVSIVGIDETSLRKGQNYITVVHDLNAKRLLFACEGRGLQGVVDFAADLKAHNGDPAQIEHVCQDMSAAYAKGVALALPNAQISYDRSHVIAMANEAMDGVRRQEMSTQPQVVKEALGDNDRKLLKSLNWARRSRLEPFRKLAKTLSERFEADVRGMLDKRSNAYVEAMNGLLQQAKRAARGFRTASNFIPIAYLRMSKPKHLPVNPLQPAMPQAAGRVHRCL